MAANRIKGITIEIDGDTTGLSQSLSKVNSSIKSTQDQLKDVDRLLKFDPKNTELLAQKQKLLKDAISETKEKLQTLKTAEAQVQQQFEKGEIKEEQYNALKREIVATEQQLSRLEATAADTARQVDNLGDEVKDTAEEEEELDKGSTALSGSLKAVAAAATAAIAALAASAESTREYRTALGKLTTAFDTSGFSAEAATETYQALQGVLGETDQAVEAANHLAQLVSDEKDLETWTDICTGVFATFGDSLPIEGLTEAANETAKVGQVTGVVADALTWAGVSEDAFNESLAACSDEQERQQLLMSTLSSLYSEASATYKETNADVIAANEANEAWAASMAEVGAEIEPIVTNVKMLGAELLGNVAPALEWIQDNLAPIATLIGGVTTAIVAQTVATKAKAIADTAAASGMTVLEVAQKGLNAAMKANPIGIVITLITAFVTAIMFAWNNSEGFRNFVIDMCDKIKTAWQGVKDFFSNLPEFFSNLFDKIKSKFAALGQKIADAITGTVKSAINGVISLIETRINNTIALINGAIGLINKIPGVNIGTMKTLSLPRLARGGVVNGTTTAIIGEAGAEAIVPLEHNTEWISAVASEMAKLGGGVGGNTINIYPQNLNNAQIDYLFNKFNAKMGAMA